MKRYAVVVGTVGCLAILLGCAGNTPHRQPVMDVYLWPECDCGTDNYSQIALDWPYECASFLGVENYRVDTFQVEVEYFSRNLLSEEETNKLEQVMNCCRNVKLQIITDSSKLRGISSLGIKPGESICNVTMSNYSCWFSGRAPADVICSRIMAVGNWGR